MENNGFGPRMRYIPIPSSLLGSLLEEIDTLGELKCTLRVFALVRQRRNSRVWLKMSELTSDPVLIAALADQGHPATLVILEGIKRAANRGTVIQIERDDEVIVLINDELGRREASQITELPLVQPFDQSLGDPQHRKGQNIFSLYEQNVGVLSPILAQKLTDAEQNYPWPWIQEAITIAVEHNKRHWAYIESILKRWTNEGKDDGKSRRRTKTTDPDEFSRRYGHVARGKHANGS